MISGISRPTLLVRENVCRRNIRRMAMKAHASGVVFRPHFKTHQSVEIGQWFREEGVQAITVSSAEMALQFADAGWDDITIAFPANIREIDLYNRLAGMIKLNLLADSREVVDFLSNKLIDSTGIFIEIDTGYGRCGIHYSDAETIADTCNAIGRADRLHFKGFLTHAGNTYLAGDKEEIEDIHHHTLSVMQELKGQYPDAKLSIGDTPSCSMVDDLTGADEIRPGNFAYYDLMQYYLGSCTIDDIAVSVACPVTGIYPNRNELVIYGGAIHLSKDYLDRQGKMFGLVVQYHEDGWSAPLPDTRIISLSQEHGIISTTQDIISGIRHGDLLGILPVHSCLTANLLRANTLVI